MCYWQTMHNQLSTIIFIKGAERITMAVLCVSKSIYTGQVSFSYVSGRYYFITLCY
jgi:hypothetical protein